MKQGIHPDYHPVVFRDRSANFTFLTRSTAVSDRTIEWEDGNTYPVVDVEVSSASHPFRVSSADSSDPRTTASAIELGSGSRSARSIRTVRRTRSRALSTSSSRPGGALS